MGLPGTGDEATWGRITSSMDPRYYEEEFDCPDCDGSGGTDEGISCTTCNGEGTVIKNNIGHYR
jgi:DnaJ-class molecular chaperone